MLFLFACWMPSADEGNDEEEEEDCFFACDSGDADADTDTDTDADGDADADRDDFVDTEEVYEADDSCLGDDPAEPKSSRQVEGDVMLEVVDFQQDDPVPEATVEVWFEERSGSPELEGQADGSGELELPLETCVPLVFRTSTPADREAAVPTTTYAVLAYDNWAIEVSSVSEATATIIPAIVGVNWDGDRAMVAGAVLDCDDEPVAHAQVFIHDGDGNAPSDVSIFYFDDNAFPTTPEAQPDTNRDNGLWTAINLPEGDWQADAYGYDGEDYVLLVSTALSAEAGGMTIVSHAMAGPYPASCL